MNESIPSARRGKSVRRAFGVENVTPHFALMVTNKIEAYPVSVPRLRSDLLTSHRQAKILVGPFCSKVAWPSIFVERYRDLWGRYHAPHSLPLFPTWEMDFSQKKKRRICWDSDSPS